jgi:hypothetical protein
MVGLDSVFITSTIDAKESRKVVSIDIPGAFLHAATYTAHLREIGLPFNIA